MNKIKIDKNCSIYLESDAIIDISEDVRVSLYQFVIDKDVHVVINLNHKNAEVKYYLNVINYDNHEVSVLVKHNASDTISNIYNHGVNVSDKKLDFNVSGYAYKDIVCECNQENQIINITDGKSTILPKLYIDSFDAVSNHAAYIGMFSKEKEFYMMSRGISRESVRHILIKSLLIPSGVEEDKIKEFLDEIERI